MTGYTVHTGSNDKFAAGWDQIFSSNEKPKKKAGKASAKAKGKKKSSGKKAAKKKGKSGK